MKLISKMIIIFFISTTLFAQIDFDKLDKYITKAATDFKIEGLAIAVVKDSQIVFSKAYGYADIEKQIPLTTNSLFNIASCTKAFTAAIVAKQVDEGKLSWDDKVIEHIPYFQLSDIWITNQLNIVDILSHRSGLKTFAGDLLWYHTDYSSEEIIKRMRFIPIENEFRSQYGYQNNMFMMAGEIVSQSSGITWHEYLQNEIFNKLEMKNTKLSGSFLSEKDDIAFPHVNGSVYPIADELPDPAGSIYSNVEEMGNWISMLLNGGKYNSEQVLTDKVINDMFTPRTIVRLSRTMEKAGANFHTYGLGWFMFDYYGRKIIYHDGGMPGYMARTMLVPKENFGFVILTNGMNPLPLAISQQILDLAFGNPEADWAADYLERVKQRDERMKSFETEKEENRIEGTSPSLELAGYTGNYNDNSYGESSIELINDKLVLTLPAKDVFVSEMEHWHNDTFKIKFKDEYLPEGFVTFDFNARGEVTAFKIDLPNPDFHFNDLYFEKID